MKVISLFSGAGGMDLGFKQAGFDIVWANEFWDDAVKTYQANLGMHITHRNVTLIRDSEIPDGDILIGGFPCQGFSVANRKRRVSDERNALYLEYLRILRAKMPLFFLAENVKGILSLGGGGVFKMIAEDFADAGYRVQYAVLNAADYGIPQNRERVFIFGTRNDLYPHLKFPPNATHAPGKQGPLSTMLPWISVGECLAAIPEPEAPHELRNHDCTKYKLRFNGHQGHRVTRADRPCPTITARGDDKGGVVIHHHPGNHRRLSAREVALIQSFPIDYSSACHSALEGESMSATPSVKRISSFLNFIFYFY